MPIPKLTIVPYLQGWQGPAAILEVNVLLAPTGSPLAPLSDGFPGVAPSQPFAESTFVLTAHLSKSVEQLPLLSAVDHEQRVELAMPADRITVFEELKDRFAISKPESPVVRSSAQMLRKYLPRTYREAFAFVAPRTPLAVTDDSYLCALRCPQPITRREPSRELSWGEAIAWVIRQPAMTKAMGMLHRVQVDVEPAELLTEGGWLFFTLASDSDQAEQAGTPGFARVFATRVPGITPATTRPLFTPVLFPVSTNEAAAGALGNFDEVFAEAVAFDDGFARIVHGGQPLGADHLDEDGSGLPPLTDDGIQLGWDDESVVVGQNRAVGLNPDGTTPPEAPRGVVGYRVDVRRHDGDDWHSLTRVSAASVIFGVELGPLDHERWTEVHPSRLGGSFWLPRFFARWKGGSLVRRDVEEQRLLGVGAGTSDAFEAVEADEVSLRYGHRYQFRVRLADMTGGGPMLADQAVNAAEAPVAQVHFRRFVPPGRLRVTTSDASPSGQPVRLEVHRPGIAFPQAVYTGAPNAKQRLTAILEANLAAADPGDHQPVEIPDPDATYVEARILVRAAAFDPLGTERGWMHLYTTHRPFPADPEAPLDLRIRFEDAAQLADLDLTAQLGALGTVAGAVVLPTARDVRLELRALTRNDMTYVGNERARRGEVSLVELHEPAGAEAGLFVPSIEQRRMRSVFLQPDSQVEGAMALAAAVQHAVSPVVVQRLAAALDLEQGGGALHGHPGQRIVFGCNGLTHYLSPDASGLELQALDELPAQWINVVSAEIDRDWTWKGFVDPTFTVRRTVRILPGGTVLPPVTWTAQMHHAVNVQAVSSPEPVRDRTSVVLVDAFVPPLHNGLACELEVEYEVTTRLETGGPVTFTCTNRLPATTPPRQVPKVVAAGHASSPYVRDEAYKETSPRRRMLWLEFERPPLDERDTYFVRVLAHAPDPMLLPQTEPVADPPSYDKDVVEPELVRLITPGQADDFAGLAAMQRLIRSEHSAVHYAVPLPANVDPSSPELFGFYTYELRVGHDSGPGPASFWSTAQGRYGPGIVLEGVQHPAPAVECHTSRDRKLALVSAAHAQPYHGGRNLVPARPNTQLWAVLYQQIHQADGSSMRNVQLDARLMRGIDDGEAREYGLPTFSGVPGTERESVGFAWWTQSEIEALLSAFGTSVDSPLSALVVEVLPEPNGWFSDPLGGDLGDVRILRTSPLTAFSDRCC